MIRLVASINDSIKCNYFVLNDEWISIAHFLLRYHVVTHSFSPHIFYSFLPSLSIAFFPSPSIREFPSSVSLALLADCTRLYRYPCISPLSSPSNCDREQRDQESKECCRSFLLIFCGKDVRESAVQSLVNFMQTHSCSNFQTNIRKFYFCHLLK